MSSEMYEYHNCYFSLSLFFLVTIVPITLTILYSGVIIVLFGSQTFDSNPFYFLFKLCLADLICSLLFFYFACNSFNHIEDSDNDELEEDKIKKE